MCRNIRYFIKIMRKKLIFFREYAVPFIQRFQLSSWMSYIIIIIFSLESDKLARYTTKKNPVRMR